MKIGKIKKIVKRPDVIPVILPASKPIPVGIPAPTWPVREPAPAEKTIPSKKGVYYA